MSSLAGDDEGRLTKLSAEDNGDVANHLDHLGVGHLVRVGQEEVVPGAWDRDCDLMMDLTKPLSLLTKCPSSFATTLIGRIGRLISHCILLPSLSTRQAEPPWRA